MKQKINFNHSMKIRWKRNLNSNEHKVIIMIWLKILRLIGEINRIKRGFRGENSKNN
jgi:hypothetical protein